MGAAKGSGITRVDDHRPSLHLLLESGWRKRSRYRQTSQKRGAFQVIFFYLVKVMRSLWLLSYFVLHEFVSILLKHRVLGSFYAEGTLIPVSNIHATDRACPVRRAQDDPIPQREELIEDAVIEI